ncbi:VOC family protein [Nocardioides sp. CER19]|uniref:VOC family protein n=1 Tax=Nocardioides sp. CER19 TaxID=3038538 RepID=UPI00244CC532|nr:VOC family protein [Nocardioides sp. CER19]MDH2412619.1 VOC family protein [Nocardioides sp. CER19]
MALARYRHLCIDSNDCVAMGDFWSAVLGLPAEPRGDETLLRGPTPQHSVWVETVPEPVTAKQRVHLDVHAGSVDDVLRLGATPLDLESFGWKVLRDPEGGELCVFEREEVPAYRLYELAVDAQDAERIATWWGDVLGVPAQHGPEWSWIEGVPGAPFESIVFAPVPEPKTAKNRIHWDVTVGDLALLTSDGATVLRPQDDEISWTVMADPEGNEFCAWVEPAS